MMDERRRRVGRELGIGGSGFGGAGQGGQSWEAHSQMTDFACVVGKRGRQKMRGHHEWVESMADLKPVGGFCWGEAVW